MVMIVRTPPNTCRTQNKKPYESHESRSQAGFWKDGPVLMIVIDDKKPEQEKTGNNTEG